MLPRVLFFSLLAGLMFLHAENVPDLKLIKAYSVEPATKEWAKILEPSGLALLNGKLYAITDKQDAVLWEVKLEGELAKFYPIKFKLPSDHPPLMDWEGLCPLPNGRLALVSEAHDRLLEVSPKTAKTRWLTPSVAKEARAAGLFEITNAHAEGVVALGPDHYLLAAERQPRGLVEIDMTGKPPRITPTVMNFSRFPLPIPRFTDFADLWNENGRIYALCRNAGGISELVRTADGWDEKPLWHFRRTVESNPYRYDNMLFGMVEGFCMDKDRIYLVFDNNRIARSGHPDDFRSWLFVFERPKSP
jgi:hypothetical protein